MLKYNNYHIFILALLSFSLPFHVIIGVRPYNINTSFGDIFIILIIAAFIFGCFSYILPKYTLIIISFLAFIIGSLIINTVVNYQEVNPLIGLFELVKMSGAVAWFLAVYYIFVRDPMYYFKYYSIFNVCIGILYVGLDIYNSVVLGVSRPSGPFQNPNIYSNYLLFVLLLNVGLYIQYRSNKILHYLLAIMFIIGILITGSRGGIIGLICSSMFLFFLFAKKLEIYNKRLVYTSVPVFLLAYYLFLQTRAHYRLQLSIEDPTAQLSRRLEIWDYAIRTIIEQPLTGVGYGQFRYVTDAGSFPHNTFLSIGSEAGLVSLILFISLIVFTIRDSVRIFFNTKYVHVSVLSAFIIGCIGQGLVADVYRFRTFWIAIAIISAYYHYVVNLSGLKDPA